MASSFHVDLMNEGWYKSRKPLPLRDGHWRGKFADHMVSNRSSHVQEHSNTAAANDGERPQNVDFETFSSRVNDAWESDLRDKFKRAGYSQDVCEQIIRLHQDKESRKQHARQWPDLTLDEGGNDAWRKQGSDKKSRPVQNGNSKGKTRAGKSAQHSGPTIDLPNDGAVLPAPTTSISTNNALKAEDPTDEDCQPLATNTAGVAVTKVDAPNVMNRRPFPLSLPGREAGVEQETKKLTQSRGGSKSQKLRRRGPGGSSTQSNGPLCETESTRDSSSESTSDSDTDLDIGISWKQQRKDLNHSFSASSPLVSYLKGRQQLVQSAVDLVTYEITRMPPLLSKRPNRSRKKSTRLRGVSERKARNTIRARGQESHDESSDVKEPSDTGQI